MTSCIDSVVAPTTEIIRFEGDDNLEAWPEGACIHIRARPNSGDDKVLKQRLWEWHKDDAGVKELEYLWYMGAITKCAVFVVSVEGDFFTDPDSGKPLDFSGDFPSRLKSAERFPETIRDFIVSEIEKLSADPLGLKRNDSDGSSKPSRSSASQKDRLKRVK